MAGCIGKPGPGRPKGSVNKSTTDMREAVARLLDYAAPQMVEWLEQVKDPERRLCIVRDLLEYNIPKLARAEIHSKDYTGELGPSALADEIAREFDAGEERLSGPVDAAALPEASGNGSRAVGASEAACDEAPRGNGEPARPVDPEPSSD